MRWPVSHHCILVMYSFTAPAEAQLKRLTLLATEHRTHTVRRVVQYPQHSSTQRIQTQPSHVHINARLDFK